MKPRHEHKFVVDLQEGEKFLEEISPYCKPDPHAEADGSYEIASIYYDTKNLQFFTDREESVAYRRKIRLRSYNKNQRSVALFLEIKEKHKNLVNKKRATLKNTEILNRYERHDRLPIEAILEELPPSDVNDEIVFINSRLPLLPISIIRYVRKTLIAVYDANIRITLDRRLTAGGSVLNRFSIDDEFFILDQMKGILEVKSNGAIPAWLNAALTKHSFSWVRFSKYASAVIYSHQKRGQLLPLRDLNIISEKHDFLESRERAFK